MGGTRGGAGASWRRGVVDSSSQSSPKRSASLMKELGELLYPREFPEGQDGKAHVDPCLEHVTSCEPLL